MRLRRFLRCRVNAFILMVGCRSDCLTALEKAGFKIERSKLTATNFYFSTLLEAVRV